MTDKQRLPYNSANPRVFVACPAALRRSDTAEPARKTSHRPLYSQVI